MIAFVRSYCRQKLRKIKMRVIPKANNFIALEFMYFGKCALIGNVSL